ncbi:HD domain-containing protein [Gluconacetobacter azotocaptans]|uniref:HD domain-containing protein n=1 Tax=Gluconacetobacter azotocaptans TaxID=142834 RepID=A0A7W4PF91_9PROT|nr:HD domain-containing protein [Gluconacetobacter azotocaptans]MBB2188641.1 HD domain-containing protein [Gluconacetobacter azotocaptans]MBM9400403.1 HD domain-containing protein [Gluconacetobacter azotocaptans]GBQ35254.1 metal dependent phosphohydrolase [Gluconacetobacter azotocaptans DSM 13594]
MTDLVSRAAAFATAAHAGVGQRRKYTNEPFIVHPRRVAELVASTGARDEVVAAAWLHDVVEDTHVTLAEIEAVFGAEIATLVDMVTDVAPRKDGARAVCLGLNRDHLAKASAEAQTISIASLMDNAELITRYEADQAKHHLQEKLELLRVLGKGDAGLYIQAAMVVA